MTFGDGNVASVKGKGTICAPGIPNLEEVLYVEGLKANLISISQICDKKFNVQFSQNLCKVFDLKGNCVMIGLRTSDNCYAVCQNPFTSFSSSLVCGSSKIESIDLWHRRLGHLNYRDLMKVANNEVIKGIPKLGKPSNPICGPCQKGKQTRSTHKRVDEILTSKPLELLHMDLMGPMRTESLGGKKYILVMVDDYSRYAWVAFLRDKSEAFINFKDIGLKIQNEKGYPIERIRSDRGREFDNSDFLEFCHSLGIKHEFSAPRTPKKNRVVERRNCVIQEMT